MGDRIYYHPVERGMELKLKEKLDRLREARRAARKSRSGHTAASRRGGDVS